MKISHVAPAVALAVTLPTVAVAQEQPAIDPRTIFFEQGTAFTADIPDADGDVEFRTERQGDVTVVTIGAERYEILDAVVFGG
jgi:hypothetical protein